MEENMSDYSFENHGSLFLVHSHTPEALAHLKSHVDENAQWLGQALAVEHRFAYDLSLALQDDGFQID
jgi:hypothetical protein